MNRAVRNLGVFLNESRKNEEASLSSKKFVATVAKGYRYSMLITCIVGIGMGYLLLALIQDPVAGWAFGTLGIIALLLLPTCFSYQCCVDETLMRETYFVLCFKVTKEVRWKDVAYKRIKRIFHGEVHAIFLYDKKKKRRISFDYSITGFGKILKMTKRIPLLKC